MKKILFVILMFLAYGSFAQVVRPSASVDSIDSDWVRQAISDSLAAVPGSSWTVTGDDIEHTNAGYVIIDSLLKIYPLPAHEQVRVGRLLSIETDGTVDWVSPSLAGDAIDSSRAATPTAYTTWVRDSTYDILEAATSTDKAIVTLGHGDSYQEGSLFYDPSRYLKLSDGLVENYITPSDEYPNDCYVIRDGNTIYVRSSLSATQDIVITFAINTGATTNLDLDYGTAYIISPSAANTVAVYEAGTAVSGMTDHTAPWFTANCGTIGAGHGLLVPVVTSIGHDKDASDLESKWTDGTDNFTLVAISGNNLTFVADTITKTVAWRMEYSVDGASLTHVSGATHTTAITVSSQTPTQQYPIYKDITHSILIDGRTPLSDGMETKCSFIEIIEKYNIVDPSTLPRVAPMDWNNGSTWIEVTNTHRFSNYGQFNLTVDAKVVNPLWLSTDGVGFIQNNKLSAGAYDDVLLYVPKVDTFTIGAKTWNLQGIDTITTNPAAEVELTDARILNTTSPPDRFIQLLKDAGSQAGLGFVNGYNLEYPGADSTQRDANNYSHWEIRTTGKSYPKYITNFYTRTIDDTIIKAVVYSQFFDPTENANATAFYFNKQGAYWYAYVDYHSTLTDTLYFPRFLYGKSVKLIESDSLTLDKFNVITDSGLIVSTTGTRGYGVFRLSNTPSYIWSVEDDRAKYVGDIDVTGDAYIGSGVVNIDATTIEVTGAKNASLSTDNVIVGMGAAVANTVNYNVVIGSQAAAGAVQMDKTVAIGYKAASVFADNSAVGAGVYIGYLSGQYADGANNTFVGSETGSASTAASGAYNTFIGQRAGRINKTGNYNTAIGSEALMDNSAGANNVAIGREAGEDVLGSGNVMIGYRAGQLETGSNKLYIENSESATPLIHGDFSTDILNFVGKVNIAGVGGSLASPDLELNVVGDFNYTENAYGLFGFDSAANVITITTTDTWYHLTKAGSPIMSSILASNITISNDTIFFTYGGVYDISCSISFEGNNGETFQFRGVLNGDTPGLTVDQYVPATNDQVVYVADIVNAAAGDYYVIQIANATDADDPTIKDMALKIKKIDAD